jgi:hypothetical protein
MYALRLVVPKRRVAMVGTVRSSTSDASMSAEQIAKELQEREQADKEKRDARSK